MTAVRYVEATRTYPGTDSPAVDSLSLDIADGELLVLVGPSGSGKSTALRMLAGLEPLSAGAIYIGDRDVSNVRPRDRDIAMVFQNYALYPQLSVAENMGFALKQQGVPKDERIARVRETARLLDIETYLDRKPKNLSGGQRQRVAMGRAIVRRPAVYLMDEPLSNLDAMLRVQTRVEVAELRDGVLQQVDTPQNPYHEPVNVFVAGFIGSPAMNLVAVGDERPLRLGATTLALGRSGEQMVADSAGTITVGVRPEALQVGEGPLVGQIRTVEDLGDTIFVHLAVEHRGEPLALVSRMTPPFAGRLGDSIGLQITGEAHLFAQDGHRIGSTAATLRDASADNGSARAA